MPRPQRGASRYYPRLDHVAGTVPPPPPPKPKVDAGVIAAMSVAGGFILGALSSMLTAFFGLGAWMPIGVLAVILAISGPSMLIAFFKLRQRNLGPILDANGWAVNAKAKVNIPFGRSLTGTPKLPPGSHRDMTDPYAEKHTVRDWTILVLIVVAVLAGLWYFGVGRKHWPDGVPKSNWVMNQEAAAKNRAAADDLIKQINKALQRKSFTQKDMEAMAEVEKMTSTLPNQYVDRIAELRNAYDAYFAANATQK